MTGDTVAGGSLGPIGRLGRAAADNRRAVFAIWAVLAVALGFLAPRAEHALSGAGWEATGSESVAVREQVNAGFGGASAYGLQVAVHSQRQTASSASFQRTVVAVERTLGADAAVGEVVPPQPGVSISPDGHTAVVRATAAEDPNGMVAAAGELKSAVADAAAPGVEANLTGAAGMWSDFNEANKEAMLKSELFSWPVTLLILVLAF
ncbi:MAG TPA: MMPL family transporter, partial [Solirubrobacterales bacterium]|nr:MMPL family transporter [Solirubrobacterales bacterium]